jgi:hypothetical protein
MKDSTLWWIIAVLAVVFLYTLRKPAQQQPDPTDQLLDGGI